MNAYYIELLITIVGFGFILGDSEVLVLLFGQMPLNENGLAIKMDAETGFDIVDNGIGQRPYVGRCGAAGIDKNQRLFIVDGGTSEGATFPARLLDEPSCGELIATIRILEGHEVGMLHLQPLINFGGNNGVFEEATCAAYLIRIRKLGITNIGDNIGQLAGGKVCQLHLTECRSQALVAEMGLKPMLKAEADAVDKASAFQRSLEDGVAVGKLATLVAYRRSHHSSAPTR